jgi:VanZ family protein
MLAFIGYAALLLYLSLFPFTWRAEPWQFSIRSLDWVNPVTRGDWTDVIINVIGYMPLGIFARSAFASAAMPSLLAFALSFGIEWFQSGVQLRDPSWRDVVCNALGGALGGLVYAYCRQSRFLRQSFRLSPDLALLGACWVVWMDYPFTPILRLARPKQALFEFWAYPPWEKTVEMFFAALLVFGVARTSVVPLWLYALLWCCIPLRVLIYNLNLSATLLAAATLAAAFAYRVFQPPFRRMYLLTLGISLFFWLAYAQLRPFQIASQSSLFNWLPFSTFRHGFESGTLPILAGKLLLYAGCIWLLKEGGIQLHRATIAVAVLLLCTELAQPYLPGRTPESTDPLLALAAGAFFAVYSRPRNLLQ